VCGFKAILVPFIVPPENLVIALLAGVLLWRIYPRFSRWLIGIATGLLFVLSLPAVSGMLLWSLEQGLPMTPPADHPPGAIVILSAELTRTDGAHPGAVVGPLTLERLKAGVALERRTHLPILVSGGSDGSDVPTLAALMRQSLLQDFQVPVRWVEDRSLDTWQNARDSAAILRANKIDSIYLVTHAWHERRALIAFRAAGLTVTAAPVLLNRLPTPVVEDFLPHATAWITSYYALHEWIGCLWYSL
jgi:uncharacterized SAM-binding protein YcdF (DUF218 family)